MKKAKLDGRQRSKSAVLRKLARDLAFPDHASENLDALFDVLTTDVEGPIVITWHSTASSRNALGGDYQRLVSVLSDAAKDRNDLVLEIS